MASADARKVSRRESMEEKSVFRALVRSVEGEDVTFGSVACAILADVKVKVSVEQDVRCP